jgi:hypothetical protein
MDRNSMDTANNSIAGAASALPHGDRRAELALRASLAMLQPLARWLVRSGIPYASFAPALKSVFVEAARQELQTAGAKVTDSSLSVLSGVHRRDIREFARTPRGLPQPKTPSVASQAFTRWLTHPQYRDAANRPAVLPRLGAAPSFEALAREVSSDVHPRTLLAEMQRAGLVRLEGELEGERVYLQAQAFVPENDFAENAELFAANVADHIAAAAHNLTARESRFLEQSVYGAGLSAESAAELAQLARELWRAAFETMAREATRHHARDQKNQEPAPMRMRFGAYYYAEPATEWGEDQRPEAPGR